MFLWSIISSVLLLLYLFTNIYLYILRRRYRHILSPSLPLSPLWFLGHLLDVKKKITPTKNIVSVMFDMQKDLQSDFFVLYFVNLNYILCIDINITGKILTDRKHFFKDEQLYNVLSYCNGNRIFGPHGMLIELGTHIWATKRKMMDPAFHKVFLKILLNEMNSISSKLIVHLKRKAVGVNSFDILPNFTRFALEVVAKCAFNWDEDVITTENSALYNSINHTLYCLQRNFDNMFTYNIPWLFKEEKAKLKKCLDELRDFPQTTFFQTKHQSVQFFFYNFCSCVTKLGYVLDNLIWHLLRKEIFEKKFVFAQVALR